MLNICEIYHIYATYMTDEIVSHICTLFGTYIVHTCETIQLSYMPHICDIFHIYLTYMKCSIFYIFNLYVIYGTYMPKCMSYMEHICAAYMRCIYVVYMLAYMQTYMTTYMLHICMFRMGLFGAAGAPLGAAGAVLEAGGAEPRRAWAHFNHASKPQIP